MANLLKVSAKRLMIDKANATMLVVIGITSFVVVFSLVATKSLISQSAYQSKVIKAKDTTLKRLKENNKNVTSLVSSYKSFSSEKVNILDGNPVGKNKNDGDNPKIVLDALPSKYDFPGLISSFTKLFKDGGYNVTALGGSDDELAQQNTQSDTPVPIEIALPVTVTANYENSKNLLLTLERSIRPYRVDQLSLTASGNEIQMSINGKTYYQPEKTLKITTKVVK